MPYLDVSEPNVQPRDNFKADLLLAASEALSGLGLGDQKEWYRRLGRGAEETPVGPALDAASAVSNWLKYDEAPNPGLPLAEALSGAIFVGPMARNIDPVEFFQAKVAKNKGADAINLWDATGWFQGPDNKWRKEISDQESSFDVERLLDTVPQGKPAKISEVLNHPELFSNYPQLGNMNVGLGTIPGALASWHPNAGMMLDTTSVVMNPRKAHEFMIHELQHGVQDIERFAPGGSPSGISAAAQSMGYSPSGEEAESLYRRLMGEVEARDAQFRTFFSPEQRKALAPYESQLSPDGSPLSWNDWMLPRIPTSQVILDLDDLKLALEALRGNR